MENGAQQSDTTARSESDLKEWQTPELIVEDVEKQTQGGVIGDVNPIDDAWYS